MTLQIKQRHTKRNEWNYCFRLCMLYVSIRTWSYVVL